MEVAQSVLATPAMASLELFLLRVQPRQKLLEIRLDQVWACSAPPKRS